MVNFKIIGCFLILAASTFGGFAIADGFRKRVYQLTELQRSVYQLQNEVIYTHTILSEAFMNISKKSKSPIDDIYKNVSILLETNQVDNVYEGFKKAMDIKKDELNINKEDVSVFLDLTKSLGTSDVEGQKSIFFLTNENLKNRIKNAEELKSKNIKMYRFLGFSIGAMVVIMLI